MSGKIEVGKWAVIARARKCCGKPITFPLALLPFVVTAIRSLKSLCNCGYCGALLNEPFVFGIEGDPERAVPFSLCKRIDDPPAEDSTETESRQEDERVV